MNNEDVQKGRDALIALGWESESIDAFARHICEAKVKKDIANGILPYLVSVNKELVQIEGEIGQLIGHINDYVGV